MLKALPRDPMAIGFKSRKNTRMSQQIRKEIGEIQRKLALSQELLDAARPAAQTEACFIPILSMLTVLRHIASVMEKAMVMDDAKVAASEPPVQTAQFKIGDRVVNVNRGCRHVWRHPGTVAGYGTEPGAEDGGFRVWFEHFNRDYWFSSSEDFRLVHPDQKDRIPDGDIPNCQRCNRPLLWRWNERGGQWVCEDMMCVGAATCDAMCEVAGVPNPRDALAESAKRAGAESAAECDVTMARAIAAMNLVQRRLVEVTTRDGEHARTRIGCPGDLVYDNSLGWCVRMTCGDDREPNPFPYIPGRPKTYRPYVPPEGGEQIVTIPFSSILSWRPAPQAAESAHQVHLATGKAVAPKSPAD